MQSFTRVIIVSSLSWLCACTAPEATSRVDYGQGQPIGTWQGISTGTTFGGAGAPAFPTAGSSVVPMAGTYAAGSGVPPAGGTGGMIGPAGTGGGVAGTGAAGTGTAGTGAAGTGASGTGTAGTGAAGTGAPPASGSMTFSVLTKAQGGRYSPKNIGAIWVADSSGKFVKTLEVWAFVRARYLTKWSAETASNKVDAIASATLPNHKTHTVTWNLKDVNGNVVPDGPYQVIVELTEANAAGKVVSVPFTKNGTPQTLSPPDDPYYAGMTLTLQ